MGRFLLLVVGDGIQEGVEQMAEFLARTPQLGFSLALVEMALFRPSEMEEPLFVQPRVVARTREVVRAIVDVRAAPGTDVVVTLPPEEKASAGGRSITQHEYYDRLKVHAGAEAVDLVKSLLQVAPDHGLEVTWSTRGPALRYVHEETGRTFKLARFQLDGKLGLGKFARQCAKAGVPGKIGEDYLRQTHSLLPGTVLRPGGEKDIMTVRLPSGEEPSFMLLGKATDRWLEVIDRTVERIGAALGEAPPGS